MLEEKNYEVLIPAFWNLQFKVIAYGVRLGIITALRVFFIRVLMWVFVFFFWESWFNTPMQVRKQQLELDMEQQTGSK